MIFNSEIYMACYDFFLFLNDSIFYSSIFILSAQLRNIKYGNNIDNTNILKVYDVDLIIGILTIYTYRQHVRNKECIICSVWVFKF